MSAAVSLEDANFLNIPAETLTDIKKVNVDKGKEKGERLIEFVKQIKNPYTYRCGKFIINSVFTKNGVLMEERLVSAIENKKANIF